MKYYLQHKPFHDALVEHFKQANLDGDQVAALIKELKDITQDGVGTSEAANVGLNGAKASEGNPAGPEIKPDKELKLTKGKQVEVTKEVALACAPVTTAVLEALGAGFLSGAHKFEDIISIFVNPADIKAEDKMTERELSAKLENFAEEIKGMKKPEDIQKAYQALPAHAQQALALTNEKFMRAVFAMDLSQPCAAIINSDRGLKRTVMTAIADAKEQERSSPIDAKEDIARRKVISQQMDVLLTKYYQSMDQVKSLDPSQKALRADLSNKANATLQKGLEAIFNNPKQPLYKEDKAWMMNLINSAGDSKEYASGLKAFIDRVKKLAKDHPVITAVIAMITAPWIGRIASHIPLVGNLVAPIVAQAEQIGPMALFAGVAGNNGERSGAA